MQLSLVRRIWSETYKFEKKKKHEIIFENVKKKYISLIIMIIKESL